MASRVPTASASQARQRSTGADRKEPDEQELIPTVKTMCPICITTALLTVSGVAGTGGFAAVVVRKFGLKKAGDRGPTRLAESGRLVANGGEQEGNPNPEDEIEHEHEHEHEAPSAISRLSVKSQSEEQQHETREI